MSVAAQAVKIHPADNVAVAVRPLVGGSELVVDGERLVLAEDVPAGHKVALRAVRRGEPIVKYGFPIGAATAPIAPGAWVHSHNLKTCLEGVVEYAYDPAQAVGAQHAAPLRAPLLARTRTRARPPGTS